jgi:hypothetical protein
MTAAISAVCSERVRFSGRSNALRAADFRVITARSLPVRWARSHGFDIAAVVLDHQFANGIGAAAFRQN